MLFSDMLGPFVQQRNCMIILSYFPKKRCLGKNGDVWVGNTGPENSDFFPGFRVRGKVDPHHTVQEISH